MKFYLGLLVVSAIFIAVTRARSSGRDEPVQELQTRNLDVVDQPVNDQYQKRQSAYYSDGSEQEYHDMYGDVQVAKSITDCVTSITKTGIKRAFPKCKTYIKQVAEFCRSPNGKKTRAKDCKSVSVSIRIAIDQCDVLAQKRSRKPAVTELCKTLVPPKKSKANCKPSQLFGPVPGTSTTARCFDAPLSKQSKTQELPIRLYRPFEWYTGRNFAQLQSSTQVQAYDPTTAYAQGRFEKVTIHTLPIGQGDCTVIYCHPATGHAILFDCGAKGGNYLPISFFQSYFQLKEVKTITVMISHGHADHYNRIPKLFDLKTDAGKELINKITEVIVGGPSADYQANTIKSWLLNIKKNVTYISDTKNIVTYDFCRNKDVEFEIVAGTADPKLKNQRGMVMKLSCESCGAQLLLAGDMEGWVAEKMAEASEDINNDEFWGFLSASHYKMSHHGASTDANKVKWLDAISPVEVHVSHQYNGRYKHPRCEALDRLIGLNTVGTENSVGGTGHDFDCIDNSGNIVNFIGTKHRIYTTAPTKDKLCVIQLTFANDSDDEEKAKTKVTCGKPVEFKDASPNELPDPAVDPGEDEDD